VEETQSFMPNTANELQRCIDRLLIGDDGARDALIDNACERLLQLTRKMLRDFPSVHRWEDTDDVFQNAVLRLCCALKQVTPKNVNEFIGLAALQIRRELVDLARHYYGPEGHGAHHHSDLEDRNASDFSRRGFQALESTMEPRKLAMWAEFHLRVSALPKEECQLFDMLWYQGLPQQEVAVLLGVTERTIQRRWQQVRIKIHGEIKGSLPGV
jgi:RNA polymerase sigma-70 factor (ECF subfamily)